MSIIPLLLPVLSLPSILAGRRLAPAPVPVKTGEAARPTGRAPGATKR